MSCFIAPLVQAIATSAYRKHHAAAISSEGSSPFLQHLPDLEKMLWGGTLMLIVDHILNGELTWRFPFFTALDEVGGGAVMLREILTVGVPMSLTLTLAWVAYVLLKKHSIQTT